jgi:hypothetical protein
MSYGKLKEYAQTARSPDKEHKAHHDACAIWVSTVPKKGSYRNYLTLMRIFAVFGNR